MFVRSVLFFLAACDSHSCFASLEWSNEKKKHKETVFGWVKKKQCFRRKLSVVDSDVRDETQTWTQTGSTETQQDRTVLGRLRWCLVTRQTAGGHAHSVRAWRSHFQWLLRFGAHRALP